MVDVNYLNKLAREHKGDSEFKKFYNDIIDLIKFKSDVMIHKVKDNGKTN